MNLTHLLNIILYDSFDKTFLVYSRHPIGLLFDDLIDRVKNRWLWRLYAILKNGMGVTWETRLEESHVIVLSTA